MNISQLLERVERHRPDINYSNSDYLRIINNLYDDIYTNIYMTHNDCPNRTQYLSKDSEIDIPIRFSDLYYYYLLAQIDYENADITRYSNDMLNFNSLYEEYQRAYNREHLPTVKARMGGY